VPDPYADVDELYQIPGLPPDLSALPPGCAFAPRCLHAETRCTGRPAAVAVAPDHQSTCWLNVRSETRA